MLLHISCMEIAECYWIFRVCNCMTIWRCIDLNRIENLSDSFFLIISRSYIKIALSEYRMYDSSYQRFQREQRNQGWRRRIKIQKKLQLSCACMTTLQTSFLQEFSRENPRRGKNTSPEDNPRTYKTVLVIAPEYFPSYKTPNLKGSQLNIAT